LELIENGMATEQVETDFHRFRKTNRSRNMKCADFQTKFVEID
jgi:hypothetical protein